MEYIRRLLLCVCVCLRREFIKTDSIHLALLSSLLFPYSRGIRSLPPPFLPFVLFWLPGVLVSRKVRPLRSHGKGAAFSVVATFFLFVWVVPVVIAASLHLPFGFPSAAYCCTFSKGLSWSFGSSWIPSLCFPMEQRSCLY